MRQKNIEKYYAIKSGKLNKHLAKWEMCQSKKDNLCKNDNLNDYINQYVENM